MDRIPQEETYSEFGVAVALRTGRRCLLTRDEYLAMDRASWDKWEWYAVRVDAQTGRPDPAGLEDLSWPEDHSGERAPPAVD